MNITITIERSPFESLDGTDQIPDCRLISESDGHDPDGHSCWIPKLATDAAVAAERGAAIISQKGHWQTIAAKPMD